MSKTLPTPRSMDVFQLSQLPEVGFGRQKGLDAEGNSVMFPVMPDLIAIDADDLVLWTENDSRQYRTGQLSDGTWCKIRRY